MTQPEAKFKRAIIDGYEKVFPHGWYCYNQAMRKVGVPDLYFTLGFENSFKPRDPTRSVFLLDAPVPAIWIEAKVDDNKQSEIQKKVAKTMQRAGCKGVVATLLNPDDHWLKHRIRISTAVGVSIWHDFTRDQLSSPVFWAYLRDLS